MTRNVSFRDFDWMLLVLVLVIATLGVFEIYSTTHNTRKYDGAHIKQIYWIVISVFAMFFVALIDYHALMNRWRWSNALLPLCKMSGALLDAGVALSNVVPRNEDVSSIEWLQA